MSLSCKNLISKIKKIKALQLVLNQLNQDVLILQSNQNSSRGKYSEVFLKIFNTRKSLLTSLKELEREFIKYSFIVKDALNPFAEALREAGVTDAKIIAEKNHINVDLLTILKDDRDVYKNTGCNAWAAALPRKIEKLGLTWEQIEVIKSRVKLGEIPIVMPGRLAQIKGLATAIKKLKPVYIKEGKEQVVSDGECWDYIGKLIQIMYKIAALLEGQRNLTDEERNKLRNELSLFVEDKFDGFNDLFLATLMIPEKPYVMTTKPSQQNDASTYDKDLISQRLKLNSIKRNNPELDIFGLSIGEYFALQAIATKRVVNISDKYIDNPLVRPLDFYAAGDSTFTRFIELPTSTVMTSKNYCVPCGYWDFVQGHLTIFANNASEKQPKGGFRTGVRI